MLPYNDKGKTLFGSDAGMKRIKRAKKLFLWHIIIILSFALLADLLSPSAPKTQLEANCAIRFNSNRYYQYMQGVIIQTAVSALPDDSGNKTSVILTFQVELENSRITLFTVEGNRKELEQYEAGLNKSGSKGKIKYGFCLSPHHRPNNMIAMDNRSQWKADNISMVERRPEL